MPDELWAAALKVAAARAETLSQVIRDALGAYIQENDKEDE